jgi:hypothetical protein
VASHPNDAIIVCLQELRRCRNKDDTGDIDAWDIAAYISKQIHMPYVIVANTFHRRSSYKATFWTQDKMMITGMRNWGPNPKNLPSYYTSRCTALITQFAIPRPGGDFTRDDPVLDYAPLEVWNCHFPFPEPERLVFTKELVDAVTSPSAIIIGDFNTIPKRGGEKQIEMFEKRFRHMSKHVTKTFHGFPYDINLLGQVHEGVLDHIFTSNSIIANADPQVTAHTWNGDIPGSDHYPLILSVGVNVL